jgi:hypothetical protein
MAATFGNDPEFNDAVPKPSSGRRFTLGKFLAVLGVLALLIALWLPSVRSGAGPAVRRAQCTNNLKQIALALYNYEQAYKALPPAYTVDAKGRPLHSWRTLILPYLEYGTLYETIDLAKPWDDPVNATACASKLSVFICPDQVDAKNTTTYLAIVGPDGYLMPRRPRPLAEITDGRSSTLAVIEVGDEDAVPWMAPIDADASTVMKLGPKSKLHHAGGTNAALADGSVHFMRADMSAQMRLALLTISGNDNELVKEW